MAHKKLVLDEMEKRIEKEMERGEWKPRVPQRRQEIRAIAQRTLIELKKRGGARPGAGRKPLGRVATTLRLKKETKAFLKREAKGSRGMGSVVDRIVEKIAARL